jgi:polyphosphate glucokinase
MRSIRPSSGKSGPQSTKEGSLAPAPLGERRRSTRVPEDRTRTLAIDIGGTGIKMLVLDARGRPVNDRARELTPNPAQKRAVLRVIKKMIGSQPPFDRVSVGFPGVVSRGVVKNAPNLGTGLWRGFDLERALRQLIHRPVRVINDADLQGYGVVKGNGVELVLTLGTGLGSALFIDGKLVPNLELGHHPFKKGKTYEERVMDKVLKRIGKKAWSKRVLEILEPLEACFNYDRVHIGGGNAKKLRAKLPRNAVLFDNVEGLRGGIRLWEE